MEICSVAPDSVRASFKGKGGPLGGGVSILGLWSSVQCWLLEISWDIPKRQWEALACLASIPRARGAIKGNLSNTRQTVGTYMFTLTVLSLTEIAILFHRLEMAAERGWVT